MEVKQWHDHSLEIIPEAFTHSFTPPSIHSFIHTINAKRCAMGLTQGKGGFAGEAENGSQSSSGHTKGRGFRRIGVERD